MSGEGPESIPTSADRRSRRPVKKRALTPVDAQAATVDALFAKPDQEIRVPVSLSSGGSGSSSSALARRAVGAAPPEIISNVQGSSSGAGSGEFHVYKASRRREYARLRQLDEEAQRDRDKTEFDAAKRDRESRDDEKTRRNREKREKAKARKAKAKAGGGGAAGSGVASTASTAKGGASADAPATIPAKDAPSDTTQKPAHGTAVAAAAAKPPAANEKSSSRDGETADPKPAVAAPIEPGLLIQDDDD